jgi:hypothetical protein
MISSFPTIPPKNDSHLITLPTIEVLAGARDVADLTTQPEGRNDALRVIALQPKAA